MITSTFTRIRLILISATLLVSGCTAGATPVLKKVDPPSWWIGLPGPMVMLTGDDLQGASVRVAPPSLKIVRSETESTGHYIFLWVDTTKAKPGVFHFTIHTPSGSATVAFTLASRAAGGDGFAGLGTSDVVYLIMPDRFADGDTANDHVPGAIADRNDPKAYHGGDLAGVRQQLGYLHDLGVNTLWLTPIWKNSDSDYHGYHVVDFYATDEHMGSLRDYQSLVTDAHRLGMKVLIDFVANHTGPTHPWVQFPPSPSWFHGGPNQHLQPVYNFSTLVDPHALPRDQRGTLEGWFVDRLPDLNPDDPLVAQYLLENALWWTESAHLDGFRLDTFPYSSRKFWSGFLQGLQNSYPKVDSVGEVSDHNSTITSFFVGGSARFDGVDTHLTTVFDFPLYYALRDVVIRGQPVQRVIDVLQEDWLYPHPEMLVTFIGNHDQSRFMSEPGSSAEKLKLAFSLLCTLRGIPQIYYGDEIAIPGGEDPDNRRDYPGGFPGDARNAFTAAGRTPIEQDVFSYLQSLLQLRQHHPALRSGQHWHLTVGEDYYAFLRESADDKLIVLFNNAADPREISLNLDGTPIQGARQIEPIFGAAQVKLNGHAAQVTMPASSLSVYQVK